MAWAERLPRGKWRGGWWTPERTKVYTKKATHPEHPYATKKEALDAAKDAEVKASRRASIQVGAASASIMWGDYWDTTRAARTDTETARTEDSIVRKYLRPQWGETPLIAVRQRDVKAWALDLATAHEPSYARRIYGLFRVSINRAVEAGLIDASPCAGVRMPRAPRNAKPVKDENAFEQLRPYLRPYYRDLVDLGQETGLRPGELTGLHADAVDFTTGWLLIDRVYVARRNLIRHSPKDEEARPVPLTDTAVAILERLLAGRDLSAGCGLPHVHRGRPVRRLCRSPLVFLNDGGDPVRPHTWWRAMQDAAERAGVKAVKPYDARHWFITRAIEGGLDLVTVAEIVGHADVKLTQEYVFRTPATRDRLRAALGGARGLTVVGQDQDHGAGRGANPGRTSAESVGRYGAGQGP